MMEYKYWGLIEKSILDGSFKRWRNGTSYEITPNQLPKWVRNKIILLNLMKDYVPLQCQSSKTTSTIITRYYLYKSEDERKKS